MRTVVELLPDENSVKLLEEYVRRFERISQVRAEFHSTVYYSEEVHLCRDEESMRYFRERLPIQLDPKTYSLGVFGQNNLVLKYENENVREIELFLRKRKNSANFSKEYSSFSPHITLGKNFDREHLKFSPFLLNEALLFDSFSWSFKGR